MLLRHLGWDSSPETFSPLCPDPPEDSLWQLQPSRVDLSNNKTWKSRLLLNCWTTEGGCVSRCESDTHHVVHPIRALGWSGACHWERALILGKESFLLSSRFQK